MTSSGRPRTRVVAAVLLVAALPAAGCARGTQRDARIDLTWTLRPAAPVAGPTTLTMTVRDPSGQPLHGAKVGVEAQMSHPGMAPVLADAVERAPGVYETSFAFTMAGDWVLLVSVTLPDGTRAERRLDVANVRPSS